MAKRFTDTDKWKKPFIKSLQAPYKLLWFYILDDCDHAGIWIVDLEVAGLRCGFDYTEDEALNIFKGQVEVIKNGTVWFIRDFVEFQYGELNPKNRAHNSVINRLNKYGIKPLTSPLQGVKDKDKDKEQEEDKEIPSLEQVQDYFEENGYTKESANKMFEYYEEGRKPRGRVWKDSKGNTVKNWKQKARGVWFKEENLKSNQKHDFKNFENVEYP